MKCLKHWCKINDLRKREHTLFANQTSSIFDAVWTPKLYSSWYICDVFVVCLFTFFLCYFLNEIAIKTNNLTTSLTCYTKKSKNLIAVCYCFVCSFCLSVWKLFFIFIFLCSGRVWTSVSVIVSCVLMFVWSSRGKV